MAICSHAGASLHRSCMLQPPPLLRPPGPPYSPVGAVQPMVVQRPTLSFRRPLVSGHGETMPKLFFGNTCWYLKINEQKDRGNGNWQNSVVHATFNGRNDSCIAAVPHRVKPAAAVAKRKSNGLNGEKSRRNFS